MSPSNRVAGPEDLPLLVNDSAARRLVPRVWQVVRVVCSPGSCVVAWKSVISSVRASMASTGLRYGGLKKWERSGWVSACTRVWQ